MLKVESNTGAAAKSLNEGLQKINKASYYLCTVSQFFGNGVLFVFSLVMFIV